MLGAGVVAQASYAATGLGLPAIAPAIRRDFGLTLTQTGVVVVRVLVPGLIPIHFGYDNVRLGCARLCARNTPGRLSTLLPHFII